MYLTAIIDVYSRFIVGWGISNSLESEASLAVLIRAIWTYGAPKIINSDQGSQFTCEIWVKYLQSFEITISMDGKGRAIENIFIERFFRSLKYDHIYLRPASDGLELYQGVKEFMHLYNHVYAHHGVKRIVPATLYFRSGA